MRQTLVGIALFAASVGCTVEPAVTPEKEIEAVISVSDVAPTTVPTVTETPTETAAATQSPVPTIAATPTETATAIPTTVPTVTPTAMPVPKATATHTPTPTFVILTREERCENFLQKIRSYMDSIDRYEKHLLFGEYRHLRQQSLSEAEQQAQIVLEIKEPYLGQGRGALYRNVQQHAESFLKQKGSLDERRRQLVKLNASLRNFIERQMKRACESG